MKLKDYRKKGSDGKEYVSWQIKKLNEFGYGVIVGKENGIKLELSFDPQIKENIPYKDKKTGAQKYFDACSVLAKPITVIENIELSEEYGNANFQIPSNLKEPFSKCQKGDVIVVYLNPFKDKEGNDKAAWKLDNESRDVNTKQQALDGSISPEVKKTNASVSAEMEDEAREILDKAIAAGIKGTNMGFDDFYEWVGNDADSDVQKLRDLLKDVSDEEGTKIIKVWYSYVF
jgi:hypothetical protein